MPIINLAFLNNFEQTIRKAWDFCAPWNLKGLRMLMQYHEDAILWKRVQLNLPWAISTNFSSAPGSVFLSGWYCLLNRLYALRISCSDACLDTKCRVYQSDASQNQLVHALDWRSSILYRSVALTRTAKSSHRMATYEAKCIADRGLRVREEDRSLTARCIFN